MSRPLIPPDKELGERIKNQRKKKGMKQLDLAMALGLDDYQMISLYETGKKGIPEQRIKEIADALEVSFYSLIETKQYLKAHEQAETAAQNEMMKEFREKLSRLESFFNTLGFHFYYDKEVESTLVFWDLADHSGKNNSSRQVPVGSGPYHVWNEEVDVFLSESEIDKIYKAMKNVLTGTLSFALETQKHMNLIWQ